MKSKIDTTLLQLWMGILAYAIACQIIGMWFVDSILKYTVGLWIGVLVAGGAAWHMWWSIDRNLTVNADNERGAQIFAAKSNMLRYAVILFVFLILCLTDFSYPLAGFLGIMGLKAGAYLQPLMKRIYDKYKNKEVKG